MNKKFYVLSAIAVLLVFISSSAYCTDWLYFIENGAGDKHYIDMDSLKRSPESIVSVKRKIESGDSSNLSYVISDIDHLEDDIKTIADSIAGIKEKIVQL